MEVFWMDVGKVVVYDEKGGGLEEVIGKGLVR